MQKKVLSEQAIYYGHITMPKDWEINRAELAIDVLKYDWSGKFFSSKTLDKVNTYIMNYAHAKFNVRLVNKKIEGFVYKPTETTKPLLDIDLGNLNNSPDFTMLYALGAENCTVTILYDDNTRKKQTWNVSLEDNKFIIFPSANMYYITNNQTKDLNYILKITYEEKRN